jgi:hypothetical protein
MFKQPRVSAVLVRQAEELSDELAGLTAPIEAACWAIDTALSALRKDDAGYRTANAANPTGGESYTAGELETAVRRASQLCLALSTVRRLEEQWAAEDRGEPSNVTSLADRHA